MAKTSGRVWLEGRAAVRAGRGPGAALDSRASESCTEPERVCRGGQRACSRRLLTKDHSSRGDKEPKSPGLGQGGGRKVRSRSLLVVPRDVPAFYLVTEPPVFIDP